MKRTNSSATKVCLLLCVLRSPRALLLFSDAANTHTNRCSSLIRSVAEVEKIFRFFDKDHDGKVNTSELARAMRCVGVCLSNEQFSALSKEVGPAFDFDTFQKLVKTHNADFKAQVRDAFQVFDKDGNGTCGVSEIRHVMLSLAEKLSEKEMNAFIQLTNAGEDEFQLDQMVARMMQ